MQMNVISSASKHDQHTTWVAWVFNKQLYRKWQQKMLHDGRSACFGNTELPDAPLNHIVLEDMSEVWDALRSHCLW